MFYSFVSTLTYDNFQELLQSENYDKLIYDCYYSSNQEEILGFLERHLYSNNFILNYIYVRNSFQLAKFKDPDIVRKCLSLAFRTILIVISHINICNEINRKFEVLDILIKKFDEKFNGYVTLDIFDFCSNLAKKDFLNFIDTMSGNISLPQIQLSSNDRKKMVDLPEPHIICNITAGQWRYPAMKFNKYSDDIEKENSEKFLKNYSARCQKYYEAYQYISEKFKCIRNEVIANDEMNLSKYFL